MRDSRFISISYLLVIILLFFYSYTQVDLSLTLSRFSIFQVLQKGFQYIGFYQRPLSTGIYILILILLFYFYSFFLNLAKKNKISKKQVWAIILINTTILTFSYNAFSYDLFNYIFYGKIIIYYHQNPYLHSALDFPKDPMLSFMHWTHNTYPYGPVWILLTIPLSFIGLQFFLPTFFLFKMIASASYLGISFFIVKILAKINPEEEIFGLIIFALNPLVILESLVSGHNDIAMMFLSILAIYLILNKKNIRSIFILLMSVGIKFATVFLIPIFLIILYLNISIKKINWRYLFVSSSLIMVIPIIFASVRTNFQPWYLLYSIPFASLVGKKYYVVIPVFIMSFFSLLEYAPFLYKGDWNNPVPSILFWTTLTGCISSFLAIGFWAFKGSLLSKDKMLQ